MNLISPDTAPITKQEAKRKAKNAAQRQDTRKKNEQKGLDEPPRPLENSGLSGIKLQAEVTKYRKKLEQKSQQQAKKGMHLLRLKTLKESILETVQSFQKSGKIKRVPLILNTLPIFKLYPYLPRFDWRDYGVVPAVRDQVNSSNCWAYTATQVYESSLMIQRANFAMNDEPQIPDVFLIDTVALNARSTFECLQAKEPEAGSSGGRYETAFNYFIKRGILQRDIQLILGVPVTDGPGAVTNGDDRPIVENQSPGHTISLDGATTKAVRDGELPSEHCKERKNRVKARGWDYVREKNPWKIPKLSAMKMALLEHGPLAVGIHIQGLEQTLTEYGHQNDELPVRNDFEDLTPVFHVNPKNDMNHYVMLIGWDDSKKAWIILNSWGEDWGYTCHSQRGTRGHGYVAYGNLGQFAAWLEAPLLDQRLWRKQAEVPK